MSQSRLGAGVGAAWMVVLVMGLGSEPVPAEDLEAQATGPVACVDGSADIYPCRNVDLLSFLPLRDLGAGSFGRANDIWGWTDPVTRREYALLGLTNGASFIDITDPRQPVYLGRLPTTAELLGEDGGEEHNSIWRDLKVYADHALIVSEESRHGLQIFDLTRLRDVTNPPVTFTETAHHDGVSRAHNLVVNDETGFAYAVGSEQCEGGLYMLDVRTPDRPVHVGCYAEDGYTHDAQCVVYRGPDTRFRGREICFAANEDTITLVDVTVKSAPVQISRTGHPGSAYTHQGWLTEDQRYFLSNDEKDESQFGHGTRTYIWDMLDLSAPVFLGYHEGTSSATDHNLYIRGRHAYEANYRSGLRILDIEDVGAASLREVAFFDVYPTSDSAALNGAWSVYPFFDSGALVVSGIEQGLFVLQPSATSAVRN